MTATVAPQTQRGPLGKIRNPIAVPLLAFITLGIYWLVYVFKTSSSLKTHADVGVGGGVQLLITIVVGFVTPFMLAANVGTLREMAGQQKKVSALTAFWLLIPLLGYFIYSAKVQGSLNDYWRSQGATD